MTGSMTPTAPPQTADGDQSRPGGTRAGFPHRPWRSLDGLAAALATYAYFVTVLAAAAYLSVGSAEGEGKIGFGQAVAWQGVVYGFWIPFGVGLLKVLERRPTIRGGLVALGVVTLPSVSLHAALASAADVAFSPTLEWRDFPSLTATRLPIDIAIWTMITASLFALIWRKRASAEMDQVRRLRQALAEARRAGNEPGETASRISVSAGRRKILVDLVDVERFGSAANYVVVHWQDREGLVREPLKQLERRLDPRRFMRVHRTSVVNLAHVVDATPLDDGSWRLRMASGAEVILSRSYREAFLQRIGVRRSAPAAGTTD